MTSVSLPAIWKRSSAECPSLEIWFAFAGASGLSKFWVSGSAASLRCTSAATARNAGSAAVAPSALDQDHLLGVLRSGIRDRLVGSSGLADPGLGVLQGLGADCAADHEGDDHEGEPSPDRDLAVLGAPDACTGGDPAGGHASRSIFASG